MPRHAVEFHAGPCGPTERESEGSQTHGGASALSFKSFILLLQVKKLLQDILDEDIT